MPAVGFLALLGFLLFNMIQKTPFALNGDQEGVLMLFAVLGIATAIERFMPSVIPTKKTVIRKTVVSHHPTESAPATSDVPVWGTANTYVGNPDAGLPEHGHYGVKGP